MDNNKNPHPDIPSRVAFDHARQVYCVYWRGQLMMRTFTNRLDALHYLGGLRSGIHTPQPCEFAP